MCGSNEQNYRPKLYRTYIITYIYVSQQNIVLNFCKDGVYIKENCRYMYIEVVLCNLQNKIKCPCPPNDFCELTMQFLSRKKETSICECA